MANFYEISRRYASRQNNLLCLKNNSYKTKNEPFAHVDKNRKVYSQDLKLKRTLKK